MRSRLITGLAGTVLTEAEAHFLRETRPAGIILFARNCTGHGQIRELVTAARRAVGAEDVLVLIDQEGGRVQRLRPPLGRSLPSAAAYAALYPHDAGATVEAAFAVAWLVGRDLAALRINCNCAPVADIPVPGAHDIIGDRAYGRTVAQVAALARAVAEGLAAAGVLPVVKHIPGHGRATADSHLALPVVDQPRGQLAATDFAAFKALRDLPAAMTAHVVFTAIDPANPASTSARVTREVIRGEIGFDGLLMSDDLSMKALSGSMRSRAEAVIAAGSDVALHCNGDLAEMREAAAGAPPLSGPSLLRFERACAITREHRELDVAAAEAALARVLAFEATTKGPESV
jgi:beta-N-acetylhexosaminidase